MPRPLRIEYEGAYYHVMNRGRGRNSIFFDKIYYRAFLETLEEAHQRFHARIHAYCLMDNHYHLLLETPDANLTRIMRHINGVYTQRHNRLKKTEGPLFRGRYEAILIDEDGYLLSLSRYIHRNPIDTKKPLVNTLHNYPWSSYPAYVGQVSTLPWLYEEQVYGVLGKRHKYQAYRHYVEQGVDAELATFYGKAHLAAVLGDKVFRERALKRNKVTLQPQHQKHVLFRPSKEQVIAAVADEFNVSLSSIIEPQQGRQRRNLPRKTAIYLCQRVGDMRLRAIAEHFKMTHVGGVSNSLTETKRLLLEDIGLGRNVEHILKMIQ